MSTVFLDGMIKMFIVLMFFTASIIITRRDTISLFLSYALQSLFLSAIASLLFFKGHEAVFLYTAALTFMSKAIFIPLLLKRTQRAINVSRDLEFHYIQPASTILLSIFIVILVRLSLHNVLRGLVPDPYFSVGAEFGVSLALIGMVIIFSRKQAISKIVGYLVMENGVVLLSLLVGELPLLIESLVLMDLIMVVMIAAILGFGVNSSIEDFHARLNPFRRRPRWWKIW